MSRIIDLSILSNPLRLIVLFICIVSLHGCGALQNVRGKFPSFSGHPEEKIERHDFWVEKEDNVIGRLAVVRLEKGDTLPDIARHFGLGIIAISAANPGVDVWVPEAGVRIMLPLSFILPDAPREGIVINLAAMRLFQFKGNSKSLVVSTYPLGIGSAERSTPMGQMYVARKMIRPTWHVPSSILKDHQKKGDFLPAAVLPGPQNPLGEYALYLSKWTYLIHGTNKPSSIGLRATNGCIRLYPEDVKKLYENTPVNTPVFIVNQPYLIGQRNGIVYIEVHAPLEDLDAVDLEKIYAELRNIEKKSARTLDWRKVKEAVAEARGIPVPIFEIRQGSARRAAGTIEVNHPGELYGRPQIPELKMEAWYILAADVRDEINAVRIAAMINHQGPQIPARVLSKGDSYRVIAGPFNDISEAKDATKRLKIDLEIEGILIEPSVAAKETPVKPDIQPTVVSYVPTSDRSETSRKPDVQSTVILPVEEKNNNGQTKELLTVASPKVTKKGKYAIQIKSYPEAAKKDAMAFAEDLKKTQPDVYVKRVKIRKRGVWYRILTGQFASIEDASNYMKEKKILETNPGSFVQLKAEGRSSKPKSE
jgi:L,D-transpeptidase ErfK/SrfK